MNPDYRINIKEILIDDEVKSTPLSKKVINYFKSHSYNPLKSEYANSHILYLKKYKGNFLKKCPGTKNYNCCGYLILHTGEGCPIGCLYCILQAYFRDNILKIWANQEDLFKELEHIFSRGIKFRIGTGEFIDSLALESLTNYHKDLVSFIGSFPNVCLEIKTKTTELSWINGVKRPERILPAWSLNAQYVQKKYEGISASIENRLKAASKCVELGFRVCLHFDPILMFHGWQKEYKKVIEMIGDYLNPRDIVYISLGSFRGMPELFKIIEEKEPFAEFIYGEFIQGLDGKLRLLRPIRVEQFKFILHQLEKIGIKKGHVYLCMESDEIWKSVFGYTPKDLGGLKNHLLDLAFDNS